MKWLDRLLRRRKTREVPNSMADLQRSDPCWCGSGRRYTRCHRKEDQQRMRELGLNKEGLRRNPFV
jgi:hypothetical protein